MLSPLEVLQAYPAHDYTLAGVLASRLSRDPARDFLVTGGRTLSWGAFTERVERATRMLAAKGIKHGDRVAIAARNGEPHVVLLFACVRIGAILVPTNPDFGVEELKYVLGHSEAAAVFAGAEVLPRAREATAGMKPAPWFATTDADSADAPGYERLLEEAGADPLLTAGKADDTCLIVYTSGTTGFPKGVMHSQRNFVTCGEAFIARMGVQPEERLLTVLPLFHINALFYSLAGAVAAGACAILEPRFSASRFWQTAVETGATLVNVIETAGVILLNRPRSEYRPEHRIRKLYGARASMVDGFRRDFGVQQMVSGFGMTEIPGVLCQPVDGLQKPGSMGPIGRHPDPQRPWAQCRLVDDEGRDLPDGETGELWVKTPIIMQGYFRNPEATRDAFHDEWFKTGDLIRRDADGYYFFVSRKKDIIRRRGENIAGAELDRVIGEHPAVDECAAIAVPSELGEDEILAAIVTREGQQLTAEEVADWCRARLAAHKVPRFVAFLSELPHTPTHKVAKNLLRNDKTLQARATDLQRP
ncbi:MAG: class I adenylate-forming enzyme family protein [Burkholderiales bacterium]